jgi:formylglycine-generating enzyme required for sulfatase activity
MFEILSHLLPEAFPYAWASDWGEDDRGVWVAFEYGGMRQGFRWMTPGRFSMGSPEDEAQRHEDETLHQATLTSGFWLAETVCTQALWTAVIGENPSHFKGEDRPVEMITWHDAVTFIDKLNQSRPGLDLRLPTEAEWEFACRAGSETPFAFGTNITPEQVNYDGNYPYADAAKGEYREQTIPVKALSPNAWGLYQMHGNVLEWCADWYGPYATKPVTDPTGPESGRYRVLRGGGWFSSGWFVRSAYRICDDPGDRILNIGFRLARG